MAADRDLVMPKLGLTMTEGSVAEWRVKPGDAFAAGQTILVVETEKIATDVEAPGEGVMGEILVPEGRTVPVGAVLARWVPRQEGPAEPPAAPRPARPRPSGSAKGPLPAAPPGSPGNAPRAVATPLARRIARGAGIDLRDAVGSGPGGRIKAADIRAVVEARRPRAGPAPAGGDAAQAGRRAPATAYQRAAARRLAGAAREIPHFYLGCEAEVSELLRLRDDLNGAAGRVRISVTHLILAAVGRALLEMPEANRIWVDGDIVSFQRADVGVAVHTRAGLYAPVVRDAGASSLDALAVQADALAEKARQGTLAPDDLVGGATTVSNLGMFDVTSVAPIISPGQSSILGVGTARDLFRPDAAGSPRRCREIGLVLSCDHRIVDGVTGLAFLNRIKALLQKPLPLVLRR